MQIARALPALADRTTLVPGRAITRLVTMTREGLYLFPVPLAAGTDPGTVMGTLFADAPGPRVSPSQAAQLGSQIPAGARIDWAAGISTFTTANVHLTVLASPPMPAESFRIAGMTDPAIIVPAGALVSIELINADEQMAHGPVITASGATRSTMPMMTAAPRSAVRHCGSSAHPPPPACTP